MNRKTFGLILFGAITMGLMMAFSPTSTAPTAHAMNLAPLARAPAPVSKVTASTTTTITLASSINPAAVGQTVTLTATVHAAPYSATPTGSVQFKVDGANLGVAVTLAGRKARVTTSWSAAGTHNITAVYSGDGNFSSSTTPTLEECVGCSISATPSANTFILSNEASGYLIHQLIAEGEGNRNLYQILAYLVSNTNPSTALIIAPAFLQALRNCPAQSQVFTTQLSQIDFDTAMAISTDCTAQFVELYGRDYSGKSGTTTLLSQITGVGYGDFLNSSSGYPNPVTSWNSITGSGSSIANTTYNLIGIGWGPNPTITTLVSSVNPTSAGQTVTFTATVHIPPASGTPTGSVQFQVDGTNLGSAVSMTGRKASVSTSWATTGVYTVTAVYSGDTNFVGSTSPALEECVGCSIITTPSANTFVLSNEASGYLIHQLNAAGWGNLALYQALLQTVNNTIPSLSGIITPTFLATLHSCPAQSQIWTTLMNQVDFDGALAISTDCTAQFVEVYGRDYYGKPGTTTLLSQIAGVGHADFLNSSSGYPNPVTSWNTITGSGSSIVNTTYSLIGIGWGPGYTSYLPFVRR